MVCHTVAFGGNDVYKLTFFVIIYIVLTFIFLDFSETFSLFIKLFVTIFDLLVTTQGQQGVE